MANNYLQLSTMIEDITPLEKKWIDENIEKFDKDFYYSKDDENFDEEDYSSAFQWVFEEEGTSLWIYGEEYANVESVADFMHAFLKENRPDGCLSFSWAETCSKLRLDNFHGGGYFITAKEAKFVSSFSFIDSERELFANVNGENNER